jgi:hypothetical protein
MSQCYRQLRLVEREALYRMKAAKLPVSQIAAALGRHRSTIYRELRRNYFYDEDAYFRGYFPLVADKLLGIGARQDASSRAIRTWRTTSSMACRAIGRPSRSPAGCDWTTTAVFA